MEVQCGTPKPDQRDADATVHQILCHGSVQLRAHLDLQDPVVRMCGTLPRHRSAEQTAASVGAAAAGVAGVGWSDRSSG